MNVKFMIAELESDGMYRLSKNIKVSKECLESAINCMNRGGKIGSLDHPSQLSDAAYEIKSFEFDDLGVQCDVDILNTPNGFILKELVNKGYRPTIQVQGYFDNHNHNLIITSNFINHDLSLEHTTRPKTL